MAFVYRPAEDAIYTMIDQPFAVLERLLFPTPGGIHYWLVVSGDEIIAGYTRKPEPEVLVANLKAWCEYNERWETETYGL